MHDALRHREGALPDVEHQQQLALRVDRRPHPMRGARQALDRPLLAHRAVLERTEHGIEFIELHLREVQVVQEELCKGPQLLRRLHEPCNTVFGSTSKTRVVPRMPRPSARQPITCTMRSPETRLPWNRVPWVSKK